MEEDSTQYEIDFGLSVGNFYRYYVDYEIYVEGFVVYNDGVTAIINVSDRYAEGGGEILYYDEVRRIIPAFRDNNAQRLTEYLCIDVETECNLFSRDPDDDTIMYLQYNENGELSLSPVDYLQVRYERLKKLLIYELRKWKEEGEKIYQQANSLINVDVLDSDLETIIKKYDHEKEYDNDDSNVLKYSLNRSVFWLNSRNCAIITAWRGKYSRAENNKRNHDLQISLRKYGYGVIRVQGCYAEVGRSIEKEDSFLVFDIEDSHDFRDKIYEQAEKYEQDCFLYKPLDEINAYLIGTNDDYGKGKIDLIGALRINNIDADNYSKIGSGIVSFEQRRCNEEGGKPYE